MRVLNSMLGNGEAVEFGCQFGRDRGQRRIAQFGNMVEVGPWGLRITPEGRPLARMVANMVDAYMAAPTSHSSAV